MSSLLLQLLLKECIVDISDGYREVIATLSIVLFFLGSLEYGVASNYVNHLFPLLPGEVP